MKRLSIFRGGLRKLLRIGPYSTYQACVVGNDVQSVAEMVCFMNAGNAMTVVNATINADELHAVPFVAPSRGGLVTSIQCNFNVTLDNCRLGIYRNVADERDLYPGELLFESDPFTIAVGELPQRCSVQLEPGHLYWGAVMVDVTKLSIQNYQPYMTSHNLGIDATATTVFNRSLMVAHAFGALPNPFTGGATWHTIAPALKLRFST